MRLVTDSPKGLEKSLGGTPEKLRQLGSACVHSLCGCSGSCSTGNTDWNGCKARDSMALAHGIRCHSVAVAGCLRLGVPSLRAQAQMVDVIPHQLRWQVPLVLRKPVLWECENSEPAETTRNVDGARCSHPAHSTALQQHFHLLNPMHAVLCLRNDVRYDQSTRTSAANNRLMPSPIFLKIRGCAHPPLPHTFPFLVDFGKSPCPSHLQPLQYRYNRCFSRKFACAAPWLAPRPLAFSRSSPCVCLSRRF